MMEIQRQQIDPDWRVKSQLLAGRVIEQKAQIAEQAFKLQDHLDERNDQMADLPSMAWFTKTPEERMAMQETGEVPAFRSKTAQKMAQQLSWKDANYQLGKDKIDTTIDVANIRAASQKAVVDKVAQWSTAAAAVTDPATAAFLASPKARDPNGMPTQAALDAYATYAFDHDLPEFKFTTASDVQAEKFKNQKELAQINQTNRLAFLAKQQEDKAALQEDAQKFKLDLARTKPGNETSEQSYINRHLNTLMKTVEKTWDTGRDGPVNPKTIADTARSILSRQYRQAEKFKPATTVPAATPTTGTTPSPAPALSATNAPAASSAYKVGGIYAGGLKYLGGDPNLETSWQKAE